MTWKAYMESMSTSCFVESVGKYAQKHNPFIYFDGIRNNHNRYKNIVPFDTLLTDLKQSDTTPNFIWITPNLCDDMHDCSVKTGSNWLASQVSRIRQSPAFLQQESVLVITWDEGEGTAGNRIPTLFIGTAVKRSFITHGQHTHYELLHTIENVWGISPITKSVSQSNVISDVFD